MKNLCSGTQCEGFQFLLILELWDISFHAVIVFGMGKNLLFQSVLGHCGSAWSEPGLSEPGVLGQCQTFTYKVTLSHPGGTDYVNHITAGPPRIFRPSYDPVLLSALQSKSELVMKSMMILTPSSLTCVTQLHNFSTWVKGGGHYVLKCVFCRHSMERKIYHGKFDSM